MEYVEVDAKIICNVNSNLKIGTAKWVKWLWENNNHLTPGQKLTACYHAGVDYYKMLNFSLKYKFNLRD